MNPCTLHINVYFRRGKYRCEVLSTTTGLEIMQPEN